MVKFIALTSMLILSTSASAGTYTGLIDSIITATHFDNKIYIKTHDPFFKTPKSCSVDKRYAFAFDGNTELGRNFLAMLTSALTTGSPVYLQGNDNCKISTSGTVEKLTTLQLRAK